MQPRFEQALFAGGSVLETSWAQLIGGRSARDRPVCASVSCAEVALVLPSILDGVSSADEIVVRHVGSCLRCQSELARYRKLLRLLNQLRSYRVEPPPGAVADVLGALEAAAQRRVVRSVLGGRRLACVGAFAAPAAAIIAVTVVHRGRLRRLRPVVLS
jgi:anti-sigma factor RsiW